MDGRTINSAAPQALGTDQHRRTAVWLQSYSLSAITVIRTAPRPPPAMCCPTDVSSISMHQISQLSSPSWISRHPISLWRCCARSLCGISEPIAPIILVTAAATGIQIRRVAMYVFLPYIVVNASPATELPTMPRTSRIEARIAPELLATVKRAADLQGRSVSDFVVTATAEAAQRIVSDADMIRLSREASAQVAKLLINPPPPNKALKEALAARRRLIRG